MDEEQKPILTAERNWKALAIELENRLQQCESERRRLQVDLGKAKEEARLLIQHAPTAIYEIDFQGPSFKSVNDAMCQMSGYSREELLAKSPFELLDEESQQILQERYRKSLARENIDPVVEYRVRTKDGRKIFAELETTFLDENGKRSGVLVIAHDVTERKRIEEEIKESERKYRELIQYAPVGIYEVDFREQKFTSVNDAMCLLTGYRRDELLEMNPLNILDDPSKLIFKERIKKWLAGEKPEENVEYRALAKDGHEIYAILNVTFTADEYGKPLGATVIGYDITERKRAEQALAKSEERYRTLIETSPDAIFVHADNNFLFANAAALQLFGAETFNQLSNYTVLDLVATSEREAIHTRIHQARKGSKTPRRETRILRIDGKEVPVEAVTGLIDYQGQPAILVMVHDITERKQAEGALLRANERLQRQAEELEAQTQEIASSNEELAFANEELRLQQEALWQSQQKYSTILETVQSGFWLFDLDGKLLEVNEAYCRMSGYSRSELLTMYIHDLEAAESQQDILEHIQLVKKQGHDQFETRHRRKDGTVYDVDIRASCLDLEGGRLVVFAWDISDRKKMERALRESEIRFRAMADAMLQVVWSADASGAIDYYNQRAYKYCGVQPGDIQGWKWDVVTHPDDLQPTLTAWKQSIETGGTYEIEQRLRRFDGEYRWHLTRGVAVRDEQGHVMRWIGTATDIHNQKLAEQALRESEEQFRTLADSSPLIIWMTDHKGGNLFVNQAYRDYFKVTLEQIKGDQWLPLLHPEDAPIYIDKSRRSMQEHTPFSGETRVRRADGEWRWILSFGKPRFSTGGEFLGYVGNSQDITERKQMEQQLREVNERLEQRVRERTEELRVANEELQEAFNKEKNLRVQLIQAEKYAALARLVGSVAHEINNPLQTIQNSLFLLKSDMPAGELRDILEIAETENKRMSNIVQQLRETYRPANAMRSDFDLIELLVKVSTLLSPQLRQNNVHWEMNSEQQCIILYGVPDQIQQVCLNICLNAIDAMGSRGGDLHVGVSLPDQKKICISFHDTGPGIPEENLTKIFEPFFSTKEKGTGLGLAICYEIVKDHGGEISAESRPGDGATFTVWLPVK